MQTAFDIHRCTSPPLFLNDDGFMPNCDTASQGGQEENHSATGNNTSWSNGMKPTVTHCFREGREPVARLWIDPDSDGKINAVT